MNPTPLSERDICTKFITPALRSAGWDEMTQIREEVGFTKGRIIVRGKLVTRGRAKRADYVLYYKPNVPIALIEAKDDRHSVGDGMQQALAYAETLNVPFVFSSNGSGFVFHDRTGASEPREVGLSLASFPSPAELWARYRAWKGLDLSFADLAPLHVPAVSVAVHVAEKLHALSMPRTDGRENSRVKDLVDVVLLRRAALDDVEAVRLAVAATFERRATHELAQQIDLPLRSWAIEYRKLAMDLALPPDVATVDQGAALLDLLVERIRSRPSG